MHRPIGTVPMAALPLDSLSVDVWLMFMCPCPLQRWSPALWHDSAPPVSYPATSATSKAPCPPASTPKASTCDPQPASRENGHNGVTATASINRMIYSCLRSLEKLRSDAALGTLACNGVVGRHKKKQQQQWFASFRSYFLFHLTGCETDVSIYPQSWWESSQPCNHRSQNNKNNYKPASLLTEEASAGRYR